MAGIKKYIAKVGINFEGLRPPVRVEKGDPIPITVPDTTIKDLLSDGAIEEVKQKAKKKD